MSYDKFITIWRKTENILEWDFFTSRDLAQAEQVVSNLLAQGVKQYSTYPIGERVTNLSSEF